MVKRELSNPWLSVVIPIFNAEKFLKKCLDSIMEQTFTNFELILVDDGSTDSSGDICLKYSDRDYRVRYFKKQNGGAYQTRIFGVEQARGTYIMFCDADDFYASKDAFAILNSKAKEKKYSVIQFGYYRKYNHLKRKGEWVDQVMDIQRTDFILHEYPRLLCSFWKEAHVTGNVWNKMYHRELLKNLPDSESAEKVFWGEDQILNLHLLEKCHSMCIIPDVLYMYQETSGGTNNFSKRTMADLDKIKQCQLFYLGRYSGDNREKIEQVLFSEVAGWFFVYVQQCLEYLDDRELYDMISDTLCLDSFILARQYYLDNKEENWDAINLLRKADPNAYIEKAKSCKHRVSLKEYLRRMLKWIYSVL